MRLTKAAILEKLSEIFAYLKKSKYAFLGFLFSIASLCAIFYPAAERPQQAEQPSSSAAPEFESTSAKRIYDLPKLQNLPLQDPFRAFDVQPPAPVSPTAAPKLPATVKAKAIAAKKLHLTGIMQSKGEYIAFLHLHDRTFAVKTGDSLDDLRVVALTANSIQLADNAQNTTTYYLKGF